MSDFPRFDMMQDLRRQFFAAPPDATKQRAAIAQSMRELGEERRLDAADDEPRPYAVCIEDHDGCACGSCTRMDAEEVTVTDLRPAGKWLTAERIRELREQDPTDRAVMVETLLAAVRASGELTPEDEARIKGASLDDLRQAMTLCPEPESEQEKTDMTDIDQAQRDLRKRLALAWTRPLGTGRPNDTTEPEPTAEEKARMDSAEKAYDRAEAERLERLRYREQKAPAEVRLDEEDAAAMASAGTPIEELEKLIEISKRTGLKLDELLGALETIKEMRSTKDDPTRTDALDVDAARARMNRRMAQAWRQPLAVHERDAEYR